MLKLAFLNVPAIGIFKPIFTNPLSTVKEMGGIPKIEAKKPFLKAILNE
jgi:hypothetical protein